MHPLSSPTAPPSPQLWEPLSSHCSISFFSHSPPCALHYILYEKGCVSKKKTFYIILFYVSVNACKSFAFANSGSAVGLQLD